MCFLLFLWLCVFLEFPLVKSYKIFTAHRFQLDTNFKHTKSRLCKGSFFDFLKFVSFTTAKSLVLQISLKNEFRLKWNIYYQSAKFYGISLKETQENSLSVLLFVLMFSWCHEISKNIDVFLRTCTAYLMSFCPQCAYDHKTTGSHLKNRIAQTKQ